MSKRLSNTNRKLATQKNGFFGSLTEGFKIASYIIGTVSVYNLLRKFFGSNVPTALQQIISYYKSLFYPIVDLYTFWLTILGYELTEFGKDVCVLHLVGAGAMLRLIRSEYEQNDNKISLSWRHFLGAAIWPLIIIPAAISTVFDYMDKNFAKSDESAYDRIARIATKVRNESSGQRLVYKPEGFFVVLPLLRGFVLECVIVILLAFCVLLASAAGLLN